MSQAYALKSTAAVEKARGSKDVGTVERFSTVHSDGLALAVYRWGSPGTARKPKPVLLFVHGYPDSAYIWQAVAEKLAKDYLVYAYDVRGAGLSEAPPDVNGYAIPRLMTDLTAVLDDISPDAPVHLVAHDWGSIQCWEGVTDPALAERFASYTSISGPGIDHAAQWIRDRLRARSPRALMALAQQVSHSWYIAVFQLPGLAPAVWRAGLDRLWPRILQRLEPMPSHPTNPTQRRDGINGIRLYRANFVPRLLNPRPRTTTVPVQLLVPRQDPFVTPALLDDLSRWVPKLWRRDLEGGHWLPLTQPALLANAVHEFVQHLEGAPETTALKRARVAL